MFLAAGAMICMSFSLLGYQGNESGDGYKLVIEDCVNNPGFTKKECEAFVGSYCNEADQVDCPGSTIGF